MFGIGNNGYSFKEWYEFFLSEKYTEQDVVSKSTRLPQCGLFYTFVVVKDNAKEPYNQHPIGLCFGESSSHPGCIVVLDLCRLNLQQRIAFCNLYFNTFQKQIEHNMELAWESADADKQLPIGMCTLKWLKPLLKVCKISHGLIHIDPKECRATYSVAFPQVCKIINMCDTNNFVGINIKNIQDLNK